MCVMDCSGPLYAYYCSVPSAELWRAVAVCCENGVLTFSFALCLMMKILLLRAFHTMRKSKERIEKNCVKQYPGICDRE